MAVLVPIARPFSYRHPQLPAWRVGIGCYLWDELDPQIAAMLADPYFTFHTEAAVVARGEALFGYRIPGAGGGDAAFAGIGVVGSITPGSFSPIYNFPQLQQFPFEPGRVIPAPGFQGKPTADAVVVGHSHVETVPGTDQFISLGGTQNYAKPIVAAPNGLIYQLMEAPPPGPVIPRGRWVDAGWSHTATAAQIQHAQWPDAPEFLVYARVQAEAVAARNVWSPVLDGNPSIPSAVGMEIAA